ncbi:MAG: helix-turn-helix domain-containing protein [Actinomycetota bacterium]|nr:helix-turn-helix domain-containing protein [Actinomycetota bacterium]
MSRPPGWTFLTNHAHVLVAIARNPELRQRDIALMVGVTERAAQKILRELEDEGYVSRVRVGRRNHYELHADRPLRHPLESDHDVRELLELFTDELGSTGVPSEEMTRAS